ncbi:MAG: hypothetical protein AAGM67_16270, partial [Bacteroidota bacterium]
KVFCLHMDGWLTHHSVIKTMRTIYKRDQFPTPYASTSAEEHYCEALSLYVMGRLPEEHQVNFEEMMKAM